jgi:transcriptional regulator with XRE-family HTH domain
MRLMNFGAWLESQLIARDMSQAELARRMAASAGTISHWIHNLRSPMPSSCRELARVLNVPLDEVLAAAGYRSRKVEDWPADVQEVAGLMLAMPEKERGEVVAYARWRAEQGTGRGAGS